MLYGTFQNIRHWSLLIVRYEAASLMLWQDSCDGIESHNRGNGIVSLASHKVPLLCRCQLAHARVRLTLVSYRSWHSFHVVLDGSPT
jgi:hypothetical protein